MKPKIKLFLGIMVIAIISMVTIFIVNGCSKSSINKDETTVSNDNYLKTVPGKKHHVVVRWAGTQGSNCVCPNCKCPGCPCPLGVCVCGGFPDGAVPNLQDYQDGYRNVMAEVVNGQLHLIFECDVALPDSTIVLNQDYAFTQDELDSFSLNQSVLVLSGTYTVDFSEYNDFGEVYIDLEYL